MTTNNHPAHGPVSLDRLHQISEILSKAAAQSDGGNLGYAMADAVKVIDGAIAAFGAKPAPVDIEMLATVLRNAPLAPSDRQGRPRAPVVPEECKEAPAYVKALTKEGAYIYGFNACRAAMLQGADGTLTNEGTIPVTQFKPIADLYGLTSPTGGETSFTFDAVEARDFIDGGWLCQEYVELERFQEAITNHTEDKLAMVDHSGDSNNMVESVTTACELRDAVDAIRNSGIAIDGEKILAERDALNSPVIPDGWVACSERMPEGMTDVHISNGHDVGQGWWDGETWQTQHDYYSVPGEVTHWMPLPAAPQQEVKSSLEHGMQRYAGAMQKLSEGDD